MTSPLNAWSYSTSALNSVPPSALIPSPTPPLLRSLDHLSQLHTILLNIFFLTAVLSVIPTASHFLTAIVGWNQHALATTWLLTEVMDPLGFVFGLVAASPKPTNPILVRRAAIVAACAALLMSVDLVFIIGQATRTTVVATLVADLMPHAATVIANKSVKPGSAGIWYVREEIAVPEAASRPVAQWTERTDAAFPAQFQKETRFKSRPAAFLVAGDGSKKMELVVFGHDSAAVKTTVCVQGLNPGLTSMFVPFVWLDKQAVEAAVQALSQATNSGACNWRVEEEGNKQYFVVSSDVQVCKDGMTAQMQTHVTLLLSRLLSARVQIRLSDGDERGERAVSFLDTGGLVWGKPIEAISLPLLGGRQVVPNVILILLACCFVVLSLFRSICLAQGGRYAARDFFIVAKALGWELTSTFARVVVPDAFQTVFPDKSPSLSGGETDISNDLRCEIDGLE